METDFEYNLRESFALYDSEDVNQDYMKDQEKLTDLPLLTPGSSQYESNLGRLINGTASTQQPALIIQPTSLADVQEAVRYAASRNMPISVCSGGHSSFCAVDGSLMLDLAPELNRVTVEGNRVRVQGGATMGKILETLAPYGSMIPVGAYGTPGFGLLTMGGVGHLSRSLGLTVDAIAELRGVRADGQSFTISASSGDKPMWTLLRGGAIFLAIITEATLRTFQRQRLQLQRHIADLEQLQALLAIAESLPQGASCSFILGYTPDTQIPAVMTYAVAPLEDIAAISGLGQLSSDWIFEAEGLEALPPFELPFQDGTNRKDPVSLPPRQHRLRTWVYSLSLPRGQVNTLAKLLQRAIATVPNHMCQIDLQHVGGVVNDIPPLATAYTGRNAEWSIVVTAVWNPNESSGAKEGRAWADQVFEALLPLANHYYIVQRHPGTNVYDQELRLAYGPLLELLKLQKQQWDPQGLLPGLT
ncbi:FAD-dependent oxidoreductase [Candidatus Synechococcus calcipolaris G9]|uniref:FAD-dependent oxidoreductase n=1 Tax=Candidatus Synechococcus calcipolaris G9 TaxID=1497997 RepID=A0ABT6EVI8_9SYNE|nr:FAD-binding oxidoreductase [Candidatus Synechococcus calcipolaris]MDG2989798.1 FAD-dependent oxidoreductase [Candidatus Synechococcus calcipolaris G9]